MKSDIHPNYHMIKVVMTNGVEFMTRSTYGEEGATLNLDIDPNTHPAWTGGSQQLVDRGGRLSRFNTRFRRSWHRRQEIGSLPVRGEKVARPSPQPSPRIGRRETPAFRRTLRGEGFGR